MARISFLALLAVSLVLAGCQKPEAGDGTQARTGAEGVARIPCALAEAVCSVERIASGDGLVLLLHHPDSGFRRLLVTTDGRGVMTADGSEQATVSVLDPGTIEVGVDRDRYRLPATVKVQALPAR